MPCGECGSKGYEGCPFAPGAPEKRPFLETLDADQDRVSRHARGPALVAAGPGSGKTRTLVGCVARLVTLVEPERILVVTFTREAAGEVRRRLVSCAGERGGRVTASTFHALAYQIILEDPSVFGFAGVPTIWDERIQRREMKRARAEVIGPLRGEGAVETPWSINDLLLMRDGLLMPPPDADRVLTAYRETKASSCALDFSDLVPLLLVHGDAVALGSRFDRVFIDEYQDANEEQDELARALAPHGNLVVIGDADQSIYLWRGARPDLLEGFEVRTEGAVVYPLGKNYRSTGAIVDASRRLLATDRLRVDHKEVWTDAGPGAPVVHVTARDEGHEAWLAGEYVRDLVGAGVPRNEIAVLCRTRRQLNAFAVAVRRVGVPVRAVGSRSWWSRPDPARVLTWARLVVNPLDLATSEDALRSEPGIGNVTVQRWRRGAARWSGWPLGFVPDDVSPAMVARLRAVGARHRGLVSLGVEGAPASAFVDRVLEECGILEDIRATAASQDPDEQEGAMLRRRYVDELISLAGRVDALGYDGLVELIDVVEEQRNALFRRDAVVVSTLHGAKGLEWDHVWLAGVAGGLLPLESDPFAPDAAAVAREELHLAYVGVTRARVSLTVSRPRQALVRGRMVMLRESPFWAPITNAPPRSDGSRNDAAVTGDDLMALLDTM